jgi:multiple sugar transport system substrate-binding protein
MNNRKAIYILLSVIVLILAASIYRNHARVDTTLRFGVFTGSAWKVPNPTVYRLYDGLIADFRALHPEYYITYKSGIRVQDYSEQLAQDLLKGTEPDIYLILPEDFTTLASLGALSALDSLIENNFIDPGVFYENALTAGKMGNHQFALPFEIVPSLMFVNTTLLEKLQLEVPDFSWNWNDFYSYASQATKDENQDGIPESYGVENWSWLDAAYTNNELLFDAKGISALLNQEGVVDAINFYLQIADLTRNVVIPDFESGKVLFSPFTYSSYRTYKYYPYSIQRFGNFKWRALTMPKGPKGQNAGELKVLLVGVSKKSIKKVGVQEFLKHISTSDEAAYRILEYSQGLPAKKNILLSDRAKNIFEHHISGSEDPLDGKLLDTIIKESIVVPRFKKYNAALELASRYIEVEQVQSYSSLKNFLNKLNKTLDDYLKE